MGISAIAAKNSTFVLKRLSELRDLMLSWISGKLLKKDALLKKSYIFSELYILFPHFFLLINILDILKQTKKSMSDIFSIHDDKTTTKINRREKKRKKALPEIS